MPGDKRNSGAIEYFHRNIRKFDEIYSDRKGPISSILNRIVRASVKARFDFAFNILGDLSGKSVLDIGCGSGRYMFKAVERNADHVVGIDAAAGAIEQAEKITNELGLEDKLEFVTGDFMDFASDRRFDVIFAVGYFDYIFNPVDHLRKMVELSDGIIYASFPKLWSPFTITRKIRLALNRCPVRFYTKSTIEKMLSQAGVANYELIKIFRDFIVVINK